jgi:carboxypeptidase Taq
VTTALEGLKARMQDVLSLRAASNLMGWDQQTMMPRGGAEARARHLETLAKFAHVHFVDAETARLLEKAAAETSSLPATHDDACLVRVTQRDYNLACKVPADFVAELTRLTALAHEVWAKARAENNFADFAPTLAKIMALKQQEAQYLGYSDHIYDALLDTYEPDVKTADVTAMFDTLKVDLIPLVRAISARADSVSAVPLHQPFDEAKQKAFAEMVIGHYGFDFSRGRQDRAVHPFCQSFSQSDVRITTRYDANWLSPAFFGTLHETGHAMYEQGSAPEIDAHGLGGGASLGVHESQSRLWENVVGRGRAFWQHFYPQLQATFPEQLGKVDLDNFYRAINKVAPSFIRVEADEVTYNLHIIIRFELERDLLAGKMPIGNLRDAWNAKYQEYLGIVPPTDTLGVLQDIHWSAGLVGYFPTYSMGNLLSVQLFNKAVAAHPSITTELAEGKFATLRQWMHENLYRHGRKFTPKQLISNATGEAMQSRDYMAYLKAKYSAIYGL